MTKNTNITAFEKQVKNKFNVYNSLFLNLPFRKVSNIGMLIPLLHRVCKKGLDSGKDPQEIIELFFSKHTSRETEEKQIDFMFQVIQYVERQIVLFDSVEDAAFADIQRDGNRLSIQDFIQLVEGRKSQDNIAEKLSTFSARIVFTAHPTQFYPPSVLDIISKLRSHITKNDINNIDLSLQQLGMTSFINSQKPTPFDEAKNIIYFLRNVYYDAIGNLYNYIKKSIGNIEFNNTNIIKLGFWPGGDRDGNPFVTSDITMAVADELRMSLMKCYYYDIKDLEGKMTFREVESIIADLRTKLYPTLFDSTKIVDYKYILNQLNKVKETVINNYNSLYVEELNNFIDKVNIFKNHFAVLDIRQDHSVHKKTVEAILIEDGVIKENIYELDHESVIEILLHHEVILEPDDFEEDIIKDTIKTITQLKTIQNKNGEEGSNRYIISNSEDIFSVLFVYALFRWCGWGKEEITFDIIPLFESMEGMRNSESIMQSLFDIPEYRSHVSQRQNKQTMMLGFSDGTKDGGYLRANWSIFETKEKLSAVCNQYDIKALFFDGRGGPPARGGGKSHQFYASQSQEIANHEIQLTIQGQTITSKYGTKEHFEYNFEQLLTAGLSNSIFKEENKVSEKSRQIIEDLANLSFEKYDALKKHKMFIPYLENKSTLKYYGQANIGSRPAKRGNKKKLELKDLRAISFVGSWNQLSQNVPGYFGIGTAIQTLVNEGKLNDLKELFRKVPFFKTLILNSMMSLSKSNFALTSYISKDKDYKDFWSILYKEYELSKEMVLLISGYNILMEEEPVTRSSIEIRERIVLPLQVIQQYALQKIEQNSSYKATYEKIVRRSLYGNINASRNSA
ncbi:MAG: phosphoenolpyruvate carboxylase [Bacteroidota bacterium]